MIPQLSNSEEMEKLAQDFVKNLEVNKDSATVVGLYGDLGAGKTFFTQSVARELGIQESIVSPTFVIEKIYELKDSKFSHLIHIDAYRIEKEIEMLNLGWKEIIADPKNLICIEWPEKIAEIIPAHIMLKFEHVSENERKISIA